MNQSTQHAGRHRSFMASSGRRSWSPRWTARTARRSSTGSARFALAPSRAELRLITCGGAFDPKTGHYLDNIVAFAHLRR